MSLVFDPPTCTSAIDDLVSAAIERARGLPGSVLVTYSEPLAISPDLLGFLGASAGSLGDGVLWSQSHAGVALAGAGSAIEITASGPDRFAHVAAEIRSLASALVSNDPAAAFPILGGFAFDDRPPESSIWRDFPAARFVVPSVLVQSAAGRAHLRVTQRVDPAQSVVAVSRRMHALLDLGRDCATAIPQGVDRSPKWGAHQSLPSESQWESSVATAVSLIRQGRLDKVVLAREERIDADPPFSPIAALMHLRSCDPGATLFAMQTGPSWFIGATPERLVRLERGRVDVTCLAGSIAIGRSLAERRRLAAELLASAKDREEHEIVVRSTQGVLEEVCGRIIRLPGTPRVVAARSVQHLETPLVGYLRGAGHVIDLVERLHPTPAVGGYPRDRALAAIRELEEIERGWYAGPFGWADLDGSGEFAVAIRSAILSGSRASAFAGCGIVADSSPHAEFQETRLKLKPMLAALGVV